VGSFHVRAQTHQLALRAEAQVLGGLAAGSPGFGELSRRAAGLCPTAPLEFAAAISDPPSWSLTGACTFEGRGASARGTGTAEHTPCPLEVALCKVMPAAAPSRQG